MCLPGSFLEYETEMGRILAVNMVHMKRQAAVREKRGNVFKEIEKNNESE